MAEKIVFAGDIGTKILIHLRTGTKKTDPLVDLTGVTEVKFLVRRPSPVVGEEGATQDVEWTGSVDGLPADGTVSYTTVANDIPLPGTYTVQARVKWTAASIFHATPIVIAVRDRFQS